MRSTEFDKISSFMADIKENFGDLYTDILLIKVLGTLDKLFEENNIDEYFGIILRDFVRIMQDPELEKYPYYRTICLYKNNDFISCFKKYTYTFGAHFSDNITLESRKDFFHFPYFFKTACSKYSIEPYASMDIDELGSLFCKYLYIKRGTSVSYKYDNDPNAFNVDSLGTPECNIVHRNSNEKLALKTEGLSYSLFDKEKTVWASMNVGHKCGFDIITLDDQKETLIEVKATTNKRDFIMGNLQHKVMCATADLPSTEYLIHKYYFDSNTKQYSLEVLKYDKDNNVLVDINDNSNIYVLKSERICKEKKGEIKSHTIFHCTPKKRKTLINKM